MKTIKNHNVYIYDEAYEYLTEMEANEIINRVCKNLKLDGYEVTVTTNYDKDYEEYNHFIEGYKITLKK